MHSEKDQEEHLIWLLSGNTKISFFSPCACLGFLLVLLCHVPMEWQLQSDSMAQIVNPVLYLFTFWCNQKYTKLTHYLIRMCLQALKN